MNDRCVLECSAVLTALLCAHYPPSAAAQEATVPACSVPDAPPACSDGMWALRVHITAPNGAHVHVPNPGCMNDAAGDVEKVIQAAVVAGTPQLALFSGPISKLAAQPVAQALRNQGGDLGKLFSPYAKNGALCAPLVGVVPVDADVKGFRLSATDAHNGNLMGRCPPGGECPISWSKFQAAPIEHKGSNIRTYSTIFMNWSHNRARQAEMIIFYKLPQGKQPLLEL